MANRGTRGAYRKEDRISLPPELQKELVEKAAARYGNCQELAKHLNIPKSSVHYYRIGRLTIPISILKHMLEVANDGDLEKRIRDRGITKDRRWATEYAQDVFREICRERLRLPTRDELERDDELRRKAAGIVSYVLTEGSVWLQKERYGECAANITFAAHETDLYDHFRHLCKEVFLYDIGPPQRPGNEAKAIRGFIYSRFIAEWLIENGVHPGDKSSRELHLPKWIMQSEDRLTWVAALQPWCDGEGGFSGSSFTIAQSRHTDIDCGILKLPRSEKGNRWLGRLTLAQKSIFGLPALDYLGARWRSEILDDVRALFLRIGFNPAIKVSRLAMKDDGFWSCVWILDFSAQEARRLFNMKLITQTEKRAHSKSGQ